MKPARAKWHEKLVRIASMVFGGYIALTSAVLIFVGVQGWGGWPP